MPLLTRSAHTLRPRVVSAAAAFSLVAVLVTGCTGRNDGARDAYGGASDGAGGTPPAGDRAGMSTDTTNAPSGAPAPAAQPAPAPAAATPPAPKS